jgi:hypothetical protein
LCCASAANPVHMDGGAFVLTQVCANKGQDRNGYEVICREYVV